MLRRPAKQRDSAEEEKWNAFRAQLVEAASAGLQTFLSSLSLPLALAAAQRPQLKARLLDSLDGLERGAAATDEQRERVDAAAQKLERVNPNPRSLSAGCINGRWELLYTTSVSILGSSRPAFLRPSGAIFQTLDVGRMRAKNQETAPFFSSVSAALTQTSPSAVTVQFTAFKLFGLLTVQAPASARGALDTTYVDDTLRISRGDRGNLFVLRMVDPGARLPDSEWEGSGVVSSPVGVASAREVKDFR